MTIQEIRIGDKVQDRNGFEFEVVALFKDGTVYCDFEGNEADIWEFKVDELERVVNDVVGRAEDLLDKFAQDEGFGNWETVVLNCHHSVIRSVAIAAVNQALRQPLVNDNVYILIDGHGDNLAYIIKDEKELEHWKSDGSIEKGDKLYKAVFVEQF